MQGEIVNIGIIGACGGRMNFSHLPNLKANPRAAFRAFCDLETAKAERIAEEKGYEIGYVTDDMDKLMVDDGIQLLVAGLPHEVHKDVILRACRAKKDLFIEKPMVLDCEECAEVMEAVNSAGIRLMIGHNRRFAPTYTDAKRIYHESMGGNPAILTYRVADPLPYLYRDKPKGGRIYGEMCHFFDLLSWFLEAEPVRVYTEGGLESFHITVRFSDESRAVLTSGAQGGRGYPKELFECFADYQSVIVEGNMCLTHSGKCGQVTVTTYPLFCDPYPGLSGDLAGYRQRMANYARDTFEGKFKVFSHPSGYKGHYEELDECIAAIIEERPFSSNEVDGARAVICCEAAVRSIERDAPVDIAEFGSYLP